MEFPSDKDLMNGPNALDGFVSSFKLDYPDDYRAGFACLIGRPNAGKSTLTNALVGEKVAITSMRPQTTRHTIRAVVHREEGQIVLVDTPGLHRPRTLLGKRLNELVRETLSDVDVILFCLPADQKVGPGDKFIASQLSTIKTPVIAVATKTDLVSHERLVEHLLDISNLYSFADIIPVSAVKNRQVDDLIELLISKLPVSPPLYPEGELSDEPDDVMIAELVREAALEGVHDELPHSLAVVVEEMITRKNKNKEEVVNIYVNLYVERDSQKAIIIGKGGSRLKEVGSRARNGIEALLGKKIYLDLHVKTAKDWQRDPKQLQKLGF